FVILFFEKRGLGGVCLALTFAAMTLSTTPTRWGWDLRTSSRPSDREIEKLLRINSQAIGLLPRRSDHFS
ncbi:MAG: hypothetical protein WCP86_07855, partial [bacterium]